MEARAGVEVIGVVIRARQAVVARRLTNTRSLAVARVVGRAAPEVVARGARRLGREDAEQNGIARVGSTVIAVAATITQL